MHGRAERCCEAVRGHGHHAEAFLSLAGSAYRRRERELGPPSDGAPLCHSTTHFAKRSGCCRVPRDDHELGVSALPRALRRIRAERERTTARRRDQEALDAPIDRDDDRLGERRGGEPAGVSRPSQMHARFRDARQASTGCCRQARRPRVNIGATPEPTRACVDGDRAIGTEHEPDERAIGGAHVLARLASDA
jgi:hypothetical protein